MTSMVVMVDDPKFSDCLGDFLNQVQSGLSQGSANLGMMKPRGSPLLSSNDEEVERVKGRVLRFDYVKDDLTPDEMQSSAEQELKDLVELNKGLLVAWVSRYQDLWQYAEKPHLENIAKTLFKLYPNYQPRWIKGLSLVIYAYCLLHHTSGLRPELKNIVAHLMRSTDKRQNAMQLSLITRLQIGIYTLMKKNMKQVLTWINPNCSVRVEENGQWFPAIGVKIVAIDSIENVERYEVRGYVGGDKLGFNQVCILARNEFATIQDLKKKRDNSDKVVSGKVFKIRKCVLNETFNEWIEYVTSKSEDDPPEDFLKIINEIENDESASESGSETDDAETMQKIQTALCQTAEDFLITGLVQDKVKDSPNKSNDISCKLTPQTKKTYSTYSPAKKRAFELGMQAEYKRKKSEDDKERQELMAEQRTPCITIDQQKSDTESENRAADTGVKVVTNNTRRATRRLSFVTGAVGVCSGRNKETQSVTYRTEKCGICSLKFAEKNKHCDQDWLGCEECETWIHFECSGEPTMPAQDDKWLCKKCRK